MRCLLFILLAFPILWIGCDSGEAPPDSSEYLVMANRNGAGWHADARANTWDHSLGRQLSIQGTVGDVLNPCPPPYCEQLLFRITLAADPVGTYEPDSSLPGSLRVFFDLVDGDAVVTTYLHQPDTNTYFQIEEFDEAQQIVAGTFEATVVNEQAPFDTLRFTDGRFRAQYRVN